MAELGYRKRARDDSAEFDPESKRIREDLLSLLVDDSDIVSDRDDSPSQDLDSVIRSFEEEISGSATQPGSSSPKPENIVDLTSDSGESLPELGQLLEFDFDDAPAPAGGESAELLRVSSEASGIGEFWEFQDELRGYDYSFGFGMGCVDHSNSNSGQGDNYEYVALDGIFDYPDVNFGSDNTWRPETLPAL